MFQGDMIFFAVALLAYAGSVILYESYFVLKKPKLGAWATFLLATGCVFHGAAIVARFAVVEQVAVSSLFESVSFYVWAIVLVYLVVERIHGFKTVGAFVSPLALAFMLLALAGPTRAEPLSGPLADALKSGWLRPATHIIVAFFAYGFFTLAFISAVIYLLQERQLKAKKAHSFLYRLPPLETAQHLSHSMVALGFPALVITIITGALWSNATIGYFWVWGAKQSFSLVLLVIYTIYLHARNAGMWSGRKTAWLLVFGFAATLITFVGVNIVAPGLHWDMPTKTD
ncbi:MAG: cytochrome c biogenesis protein CcsA [Chloroflexi bacterium]|nr:cytochrome c biogenesis protein CcsA [Chloroflexota bacterium]